MKSTYQIVPIVERAPGAYSDQMSFEVRRIYDLLPYEVVGRSGSVQGAQDLINHISRGPLTVTVGDDAT